MDFNLEIPLGLELINLPLHLSDGITSDNDENQLNLWIPKNRTSEEILALNKSSFPNENEVLQQLSPSRRIIAYNNIGVIRFCSNQPESALEHFDNASLIMEETPSSKDYQPMDYLNIAILLNQTRTCIRLNKMKRALDLIVKMKSHAVALEMPVLLSKSKFLCLCFEFYVQGLYHHRLGEHVKAVGYYNQMLAYTKNEFGNYHIYTASILEKIGNVLFDQKKYKLSMLSYLASLRVYEKLSENCVESKSFGSEHSRILYAIGRIHHDQDNLVDALSCYLKALLARKSICKGEEIGSIRILCNVERIYHALGDLSKALEINLQIVKEASTMLGGEEASSRHPFVQSQYKTMGNLYIEMAQHDEAMKSFSMVRMVSDSKGDSDFMKASRSDLKSAALLCKIRREMKRHAAAA